ncbi:hypothetical protein OS493_012853 [Desmophyllum pertusum]|uniref:Uncharacterized protein n=1 Tax=Desmophyllum pertusum TaxID=174260 RepID=A0A9W9Z2S3_9CNID|nr:hypothetical protein OS493_012853 [Desmophyllum pertusum]
MEFLEENVSMLSASPLLYVHCLDFDSQTYISLSNLDCCRFLTVLAHVSFPNKLRERRLCLFFDTQKLKDLETKTSPAVIKVKSSCIHKLENESDEDQGRRVVVIFNFDLMQIQSSIATNLAPYDDYEGENSIPEMPWLDITLVACNCSRFPSVSNVAVRSVTLPASQTQSDSSDNTSEHDDLSETEEDIGATVDDAGDVEVEETQYAEYFKLKGSTYHEHFQNALRQCKRLLLDREEVRVQLVIEPANAKDENAIVVQAELEGMWHPVGYIPGAKVRKAMDGLNKKEIRTVKFKGIEWKFIYGLGEFKYVSSIVVTKVNKWLPSDKDYQYNDIF